MNFLERMGSVKKQIEEACHRSSRNPSDIELMLVTKTVPAEKIRQALEYEYRLFGENKVQEVVGKWKDPKLEHLKPEFIGHLQSNKIKTCLDVCGRIHSVDRISLVEALDQELQKRGEQREVFLQVNTSNEKSKYGVALDEALHFAKQVSKYSTLKVTGLMTLAVFSKDASAVRSCFKNLKQLQAAINDAGIFPEELRHLSMGMSSDFGIAIEEGSTLIRVGTAVFGERRTPDSYYWPEDFQTAV